MLERYELARVTGALGFLKEKRIKVIDLPFTQLPNNPSAILFSLQVSWRDSVWYWLCYFCTNKDHTIRYKKQLETKLGQEVLTRIHGCFTDLRGGA